MGDAELLRDEVMAFTREASERGVQVETEVARDMVHGWVLNPGVFPEAATTIERIAAFVARLGKQGGN